VGVACHAHFASLRIDIDNSYICVGYSLSYYKINYLLQLTFTVKLIV
jgi:hypothetical protein